MSHSASPATRRSAIVGATLGCLLGVLTTIAACSREHEAPRSGSAPESSSTEPTSAPAASGVDCRYVPTPGPSEQPVNPPQSGPLAAGPEQVVVQLRTDRGDIGLTLDSRRSPCTVNSFVNLTRQHFFDDTRCHRLTTAVTLSVLQCGDPRGDGTGGPGYQFANEYPTDQYPPNDPALNRPISYPRGTLAMANAGPGTNGSQFFLVYADSQLPPQYTIFGTIDDTGLTTLDTIAAAGVADGGQDGPPTTPVTITSAQLG